MSAVSRFVHHTTKIPISIRSRHPPYLSSPRLQPPHRLTDLLDSPRVCGHGEAVLDDWLPIVGNYRSFLPANYEGQVVWISSVC